MFNRLQLNPAKTEVLWSSSVRRQHQIPTGSACVGDTSVLPVRTVRDLGVYIDADVTTSAHVTAIIKACFAGLRQIRSVRRSLTRTTLTTLVHALVATKWTTAAQFSRAFPDNCYKGCSLSSTPPLVSCSRRGSRSTNSTPPWTTLAESSGENSVPVMCSRTVSSECFNVDAGCTVHTTHHTGWSSFPGGCCSSVECSSAVCSFCAIVVAVPPWPEDVTVPIIVLFTIHVVSSCVTTLP